jgi:pimeloyl-ACP methyl ester carboxylesterase
MQPELEVTKGFLAVTGGQLYYEVAGSGFPLVLIHAGIADCTMWDEQYQVFARHYRVIRYDVRGYGQTQTEDIAFSNRQDLLDLLTHLQVERAYILGLSRGGQIATDFTLEHPEKVAALIPVAAGLGGFEFESPAYEIQKFAEVEAVHERGDYIREAEMDVEIWVDGFHRPVGSVDSAIRHKVYNMSLASYNRPTGQSIPLQPPAAQRLGEIQVPTLVIVGDIDVADTIASCQALAQGIKGARYVVIKDVAHMVNMEKPQEFNQLVLDFLRTVDSAK